MKHELERVVWPAAGGALVFGLNSRVRILAGEPSTEDDLPRAFPWAIIVLGSGTIDGNAVNFCEHSFQVFTAAHVMGDHLGEMAVVGGAVENMTTSPNRGASELVERVHAAIGSLTGVDGARVLMSATSVGSPKSLGNNAHLVMGEIGLTALCTVQASYAPPQLLTRTTGKWTWDGSQCKARFDFLRFNLIKKAGLLPALTPEDGTSVYTGTEPESTATGAAGSTYTCFAQYDSRGNGIVEGSSDVVLGSYRTI
jgi:hypothetical protein